MPLNFNKHAQKGNRFLNELAAEFGSKSNKVKAGKALRAMLKTLRNHLTISESFQLISQLPMALKALYVDGWIPSHRKEVSRKKNDFIMEFLKYQNPNTLMSASEIMDGEKSIKAVFKILKKFISQGEFQDIENILPSQLKQLVRDSIYVKKLIVKMIPEKHN